MPCWPEIHGFLQSGTAPIFEEAGIQLGFLLVAAIVLFGLGHALLALAFVVRSVRRPVCRGHETKYQKAVCQIKEIPVALPKFADKEMDAHLPLEMWVLVKQPALHATFIERCNTLSRLRLGLATALLCAGLIAPILSYLCGQSLAIGVCLVALVALVLGLLLLYQYFITQRNFLVRVEVAYDICEKLP